MINKGRAGFLVIALPLFLLILGVALNVVSGGHLGFGVLSARPPEARPRSASTVVFQGVPYSSAEQLRELEAQHTKYAELRASGTGQGVLEALQRSAPDLSVWVPSWAEWCVTGAMGEAAAWGVRSVALEVQDQADDWAAVRCGYVWDGEWRAPDGQREAWLFLVHRTTGEVLRCSRNLAGSDLRRCFG
jgi:hypothetical protein